MINSNYFGNCKPLYMITSLQYPARITADYLITDAKRRIYRHSVCKQRVYMEKRIFNNESVRPDIPLSPNIFCRVESSTAAVFRDKIFPICLGSQSGAPPLKPEKRGEERENSQEKKERKEDGKMNVRGTRGEREKYGRVMVENPSCLN